MRRHLYIFVTTILLSAWIHQLQAQAWERSFGTPRTDQPYGLTVAPDGGFLMIGYTTESTGKHDIFIVKTDIDGRTQWSKTIGKTNIHERAYAGISNADGTFMVVGMRNIDTSQLDGQAWLLKLNAQGDTLWTKSYFPNFCTDVFYGIQRLKDDTGYIITGSACVMGGQEDLLVLKTDLNGNVIWTKTFGIPTNFEFGKVVIQTSDNGFIIGGTQGFYGLQNQKAQILKLDRNGNLLWQKIFGTSEPNGCQALLPDTEGGVFALGVETDTTIGTSTFFKRFTADGREVLSKNYLNLAWGFQFFRDINGGFTIISGNKGGRRHREFLKIDANGNVLSRKIIRIYNPTDELESVVRTVDSAIVMLGKRTISGNQNYHLSKIDKNGNGSGYTISGRVFVDQNNNCFFNAGEKPLINWQLKAEGPAQTFWGFTDSLGNYQINVDSSVYRVSLVKPTNYWQPCRDSIIIGLSSTYSAHVQDFAVQSRTNCPLLDIDIATPFLRRCFDNTYIIRYANRGTVPARNASVRLVLDTFLTYNSATLPLSNRTGNVLYFNVGDVAEGAYGEFRVNTTVRCNDTYIGQSHCVEAHIFPDSICAPMANWSGASIQVKGVCERDSVVFEIKNVGTGTTTTPIKHIVIEDNIVFLKGTVNNLQPQASKIIKIPVSGNTYRIISDQEPSHPNAQSQPTTAVEGCRTQPSHPLSIGYVTQFQENDSDPFTSINCQQNIGSFDPNDKTAQPVGIGNQHFIDEKAEIDYTIRFQNTGTDTAFTVVVRDTLSSFLDVSTLKIGASSHRYEYAIIEGKILKFTFRNINLPDSNRNKIASQGFLRYTIRLKNNVPFGTGIENRAAIYFDFNAPIITNRTFHTLRKPQLYGYQEFELCTGNAYKGYFFSKNTRLYDTLRGIKWDSISIQNLKILPVHKHNIDTSLRPGFRFNGILIQRDTNIIFRYSNQKGCDSTVTYYLRLLTGLREADKLHIKIYPHPFTDKTLFLITPPDGSSDGLGAGKFELQLYDTMGRLLLHQVSENNAFILEKGDKSAGLYVFKIVQNQRILSVGKLIISN